MWQKSFHLAAMNPAGIFKVKVNNRSTRSRYEICSKLAIKKPENIYVFHTSFSISNNTWHVKQTGKFEEHFMNSYSIKQYYVSGANIASYEVVFCAERIYTAFYDSILHLMISYYFL